MPLFRGVLPHAGTPNRTITGQHDRNRVSIPGLTSLHFMTTEDTRVSNADWGIHLLGYEELSLPGFESTVVNPTSSDNFTGWAPPIVVGRTPIPRDVVLYSDPTHPVHNMLFNARLNQRFEFRHVMPPPRMHLIHTIDILQSISGGSVSQQEGWRDTVQMTPYIPPIRIPGSYYISDPYNHKATPTVEITMRLIPDSGRLSTSPLVPGADAPDGEFKLTITVATGNMAFSETATSPGGGTDYDYQGILHVPAVGYSVSTPHAGGATFSPTDALFNDNALGLAIVATGAQVFMAFWEYPRSRGALND